MLPKVPINELGKPVEKFLIEYTRQLERELARRPATKADGVLYFHEGQVVRLISPNGSVFQLSVDDEGRLTTAPGGPVAPLSALDGYVGRSPEPTAVDLNNVTGGGFRIIVTTADTLNTPPGVNGWGVVLHVGRANNRRIQLHLNDGAAGIVPALSIRSEGTVGGIAVWGNWYRLTQTEAT